VADLADFNGDTYADILWRNSASGLNIIWLMDGFTNLAAQSIGVVDDPDWVVQ
jgi:hypothetical protein